MIKLAEVSKAVTISGSLNSTPMDEGRQGVGRITSEARRIKGILQFLNTCVIDISNHGAESEKFLRLAEKIIKDKNLVYTIRIEPEVKISGRLYFSIEGVTTYKDHAPAIYDAVQEIGRAIIAEMKSDEILRK